MFILLACLVFCFRNIPSHHSAIIIKHVSTQFLFTSAPLLKCLNGNTHHVRRLCYLNYIKSTNSPIFLALKFPRKPFETFWRFLLLLSPWYLPLLQSFRMVGLWKIVWFVYCWTPLLLFLKSWAWVIFYVICKCRTSWPNWICKRGGGENITLLGPLKSICTHFSFWVLVIIFKAKIS